LKLHRYEDNPVLTPRKDSDWESACACNPGAWYDGEKVILLYRGGPDNEKHPIYFGLAESEDGLVFERVSDEPVFGPSNDGFDGGCVEDARIVRFGNIYYVTYATRMFTPGPYWKNPEAPSGGTPSRLQLMPPSYNQNLTRSALAATRDFRTWFRLGPITPASVDDRDAIIFPEELDEECVMLHRPLSWVGPEHGCEKPSIWLSYGADLMSWQEDHLLAQPTYAWESAKIGGGAPPLKTEKGWLFFYHGVDHAGTYRVGAMLLDLNEPLKIIARTPQPLLEPEAPYEKEGLVPNVVFPTGNVIINNTASLYYGAADTCTCVASIGLDEILGYLLSHPWKG